MEVKFFTKEEIEAARWREIGAAEQRIKFYRWAQWLLLVMMGYILLSLWQLNAFGQTVIPNSFTPTNVCYTDEQGNIRSEIFNAPNVLPDFGPVGYITASPLDPNRDLNQLPTFGLAAWHHWLFSTFLMRAQRQYAACVSRINAYHELLGTSQPPLDSPLNELYAIVTSVREYDIPFHPLATSTPSQPPSKSATIQHIFAALFTYNLTVYHIGLCEAGAVQLKAAVQRKMRR